MKYLLVLSILLLITCLGKGQSNTTPITKTVIEGYFDDERIDTVKLTFYEQRLGNTSAGSQTQICITEKGHFLFTLPMNGNISYVTIGSIKRPSLMLHDYLIKNGDSNFIQINTSANKGEKNYTNGLVFSGKNCGSFRARYDTDSAYIEAVKRVPHTSISLDSLHDNIRALWYQFFSSLDQSLIYLCTELKKFENETDKDIYEILNVDYRYNIEFAKLVQFRYYWGNTYRHPDSLARRRIMID